MNLIEKLNAEIKTAMKQKDKPRLIALKNLKAEIQNYQIANKEADEAAYISVVQKFVAQREKTAEIYKNANATDNYNSEVFEAEVATGFLPTQIGEIELAAIVDKTISENGFSSIRDMGKLMKNLRDLLAGSADTKLLGKLCKDKLTN